MKLIKEIKAFVTDVATMCDTELYDLSKIDVAIRVMEMIDDHKPSPTKLRPMSELPEKGKNVLFLVGRLSDAYNKNYWRLISGRVTGSPRRPQVEIGTDCCYEEKGKFVSYGNCTRVLGWQPLPNANEMEL